MPATPRDSALHACLLGAPGTSAFFSDEAEVAAMLRAEGALARAQGGLGLIPPEAAAISRAAGALAPRAGDLASQVGRDGVPVPALAAALRAALPPKHATWVQ